MIKDLPLTDKPREKALLNGIESLTDAELIAIILRTGIKDNSAIDLANRIIKEISSLNNPGLISLERLKNIKGVGSTKAITLLAAIEIGKRSLKKPPLRLKLKTSKEVYEQFKYYFVNQKQEIFMIIFLDANNKVITFKELYRGTMNNLSINNSEIFKECLLNSSNNIILIHNHPSDSLFPSKQDVSSTKLIINSARILNINIIDHIIVTSNNYYSFRDNGDI